MSPKNFKLNNIYQGKALNVLKQFPNQSINTCVTSPPYWGLRDYGVEGQLGLEDTPEEYVDRLVGIFTEVKRVLKDDGTLWLNLGDSYATHASGSSKHSHNFQDAETADKNGIGTIDKPTAKSIGLKEKDLVGIPWRVAFALQEDGWYLRNDIIWHKPNPMPESVTDRCTTSHEYIFLMSKSKQYYYDQDAIKEPSKEAGKTVSLGDKSFSKGQSKGMNREPTGNAKNDTYEVKDKRNKRDVWQVTTQPFPEAHFAVYPPDLIRPCIRAGCPSEVCPKCGQIRRKKHKTVVEEFNPREDEKYEGGSQFMSEKTTLRSKTKRVEDGYEECDCRAGFEPGIVLDPFFGAGTTGLVAKEQGCNYVGIELNKDYIEIAEDRLSEVQKKLF